MKKTVCIILLFFTVIGSGCESENQDYINSNIIEDDITDEDIIEDDMEYNDVSEENIYDFPIIDEPLIPIYVDPSEYLEALSYDDIIDLNNGDAEFWRWNFDNRRIKGRFSPISVFTPEDAVLSLTSIRELYDIESFSFICTTPSNSGDRNVYYLQQVYEGIPVQNGRFEVFVSSEGEPFEVGGIYIDAKGLNPIPDISAYEASEVIELEEEAFIRWSQLVVFKPYPYDKDALLCWYFQIDSIYIDLRQGVIVDAHTGEFVAGRVGAIVR